VPLRGSDGSDWARPRPPLLIYHHDQTCRDTITGTILIQAVAPTGTRPSPDPTAHTAIACQSAWRHPTEPSICRDETCTVSRAQPVFSPARRHPTEPSACRDETGTVSRAQPISSPARRHPTEPAPRRDETCTALRAQPISSPDECLLPPASGSPADHGRRQTTTVCGGRFADASRQLTAPHASLRRALTTGAATPLPGNSQVQILQGRRGVGIRLYEPLQVLQRTETAAQRASTLNGPAPGAAVLIEVSAPCLHDSPPLRHT